MFPPSTPASAVNPADNPEFRMILEQCRLAESTAPYRGMPGPAPWLIAQPTASDVARIPEL